MNVSDELVGKTVGDFVLRERLAAGGGGVTYLAEQASLGREAVVKVLLERSRADPRQKLRFMREARLASRVDHPYAAHVYNFGETTDGVLWIAMEYVRGDNLWRLLRSRGPPPLNQLLPFLQCLGEVLHAVHEEGIVHRDVKPANVMCIWRSGRMLPKLLDLGVALSRDPIQGLPALSDLPPAPVADNDVAQAAPTRTGEKATAALEPTKERITTQLNNPVPAPLPPLAPPSPSPNERLPTRTHFDAEPSMSLTNEGEAIGSASYMSPEQWRNSSAVDRRADVYALGVVAYECLTGKLPFSGGEAKQMLAHLQTPPPPLPDTVPQPVRDVVMKALSKRAEDRQPTALDFSEELARAADGVRISSQLPKLRLHLLQDLLNDAPRPLAEAAAVLDAARAPREALLALRRLGSALVHYLAMLALAARGKLGAPPAGDSARLLELLGTLKQTQLKTPGWAALVVELLSPLRKGEQTLVRLVDACLDAKGPRPWLRALGGDVAGVETLDADGCRLALGDELPQLERALDEASFIFELPLVLLAAHGAERWTGTRKPRAPLMELASPLPGAQEFVLCNETGAALLRLSPLLQAEAPTPGAPLEVFWLEGAGRHGARLVSVPQLFEHQDEGVWSFLQSLFPTLGGAASAAANEQVKPYRGLSSFTRDDADAFFGREREAQAFSNRLKTHPFLAVVGPSGVGKSSFVQAGVLPLLGPEWVVIIVRPGTTPLSTLAARMHAAGLDPKRRLAASKPAPGTLNQVLLDVERDQRKRVLLLVNQFEELITLCASDEERLVFAGELDLATSGVDAPHRVVITLRDDFLIRAQALAPLRDKLGTGLQLLGTPDAADLRRIVTQPLRRLDYAFEDAALVEEMVKGVAQTAAALALLSFACAQLWERRDAHFRRLTRRAFTDMGGVGGALAQHAEAVLAALSPDAQRLSREAFRHLVSSQGTRVVLGRLELDQLLGASAAHPERQSAVTALVAGLTDARLLVQSGGDDATIENQVEIVHEALITSWPRLVQWQREHAESARLKDALRAAAQQWAERSRPSGLLWRKEVLLEYRVWRARYTGHLTDLEEAFAAASLRDEARGRTLRRVAVAAVVIGLTATIAILARANVQVNRSKQVAEQKTLEAVASLARQQGEQARQLGLFSQPLQAYPYAAAALANGNDVPAVRFALGNALELMRAQDLARTLKTQPYGVALSPDGEHLYIGDVDGDLHDFSTRTWRIERSLPKAIGGAGVISVSVSKDGTFAVLSGIGANVSVVDLSAFTVRQKLDAYTGKGAAYDWTTVALWKGDSAILAVDIRGDYYHYALRGDLFELKASGTSKPAYSGLTVSGDGNVVVATGTAVADRGNGGVAVFEKLGAPALLDEKIDVVRSAALLEGGSGAWLGTTTGEIVILKSSPRWHIDKRAVLHGAAMLGVALDEKLGRAVTLFEDGQLDVWKLADLSHVAAIQVHTSAPRGMVLLKDRGEVATFGTDNQVVFSSVWDGSRTGELVGPTAALQFVTPLNDGRLITSSLDATLRVWNLKGLRRTAYRRGTFSSSALSYFVDAEKNRLYEDVGSGVIVVRDATTFEDLERRTCPGLSRDDRFLVTHDGLIIGRFRDDVKVKFALVLCPEKGGPVSEPSERISDLTMSPDGHTIEIGYNSGKVEIRDMSTGHKTMVPPASTDAIAGVTFSADGKSMMLAVNHGGTRVVDVATGNVTGEWQVYDDWSFPVSWSPDGVFTSFSYQGGRTQLWRVAQRSMAIEINPGSRTILDEGWLHGSSLFYTVGMEGRLVLFDASTWQQVFNQRWATATAMTAKLGDGLASLSTQTALSTYRIPYFDGDASALKRDPCQLPYVLKEGRLDVKPHRACDGDVEVK